MDMDSSTLVEIVPEVASQIDSPAAEEAFLTHENDKHQPGKAKKKPIPKSKPRKKITITRDPEPEPEVLLVDDPVMPVAPRLPVARVKGFMKMSLDGKNTSADATYLMTKATVILSTFRTRFSFLIEKFRRRNCLFNNLERNRGPLRSLRAEKPCPCRICVSSGWSVISSINQAINQQAHSSLCHR